jgi:hypothetical protein
MFMGKSQKTPSLAAGFFTLSFAQKGDFIIA